MTPPRPAPTHKILVHIGAHKTTMFCTVPDGVDPLAHARAEVAKRYTYAADKAPRIEVEPA